jgi:hypothetical protein
VEVMTIRMMTQRMLKIVVMVRLENFLMKMVKTIVKIVVMVRIRTMNLDDAEDSGDGEDKDDDESEDEDREVRILK